MVKRLTVNALLILRKIARVIFWRLNELIWKISQAEAAPRSTRADEQKVREVETFLLSLDPADEMSRRYLEKHLGRITKTVVFTPASKTTGRALELGCYMQLTPTLKLFNGYTDIRGAYFGASDGTTEKSAKIRGREVFKCQIDLFNAERDRFPYPDSSFELVLGCEVIEHMQSDPMHMLFEAHRVLENNGTLVVTTPNCASWSSLACVLGGHSNPYIYSQYSRPDTAGKEPGARHMREYTAEELRRALICAGFRIETLRTESTCDAATKELVESALSRLGYPITLRGEQVYCSAVKVSDAKRIRHPQFLYD